jgi:hypothetical protein
MIHTAQVVVAVGNAVGRGGVKVIAVFVAFITPAPVPGAGETQEALGFAGFTVR